MHLAKRTQFFRPVGGYLLFRLQALTGDALGVGQHAVEIGPQGWILRALFLGAQFSLEHLWH
jgi:hypothetical protein